MVWAGGQQIAAKCRKGQGVACQVRAMRSGAVVLAFTAGGGSGPTIGITTVGKEEPGANPGFFFVWFPPATPANPFRESTPTSRNLPAS
jgi:hypothetical protein